MSVPVVPISRDDLSVELVQQNNSENRDLTKGLQSVTHMVQDEEPVQMSIPVTAQGSIIGKENVASRQSAVVLTGPAILQEDAESSIQTIQQPQVLADAFAQAVTPAKPVSDKDKTISFFSTGNKNDLPVGYLICTAGEDFGCGFLLKSGNNAIGRGQSMDVVIMDPKVSREKQAYVMYEPKNRKFYLKPGEGSGLCYLNGEVVLAPVELTPLDMVGVGDTELMLIAVCCEKFGWEDYEV